MISLRLTLSPLSSSCSRSSAATASRCASGIADRSMIAVDDMAGGYPEAASKARPFSCLIHSAAAGRRISRAFTLRQSRPANRASNCARFKVITPSRTAGQVKELSSSRL